MSTELNEMVKSLSIPEVNVDYLRRIEKPTFQGFEKLLEPLTCLPVDIASVASGDVVRFPQQLHYSKTSPTNIALAFLYLILSVDRGYRTDDEAYRQAHHMLDILEKISTCEHFHYNWYHVAGKQDCGMVKRVPEVCLNDFVSSVDNGNLDIALMIVAGRWPETELENAIERFLIRRNYLFFFNKNPNQPANGLINLGYDARSKIYSSSDYSIFNGEARMTALIAILKGDVPDSVWKKQSRLVRIYRIYHHDIISVVAPWGGSLFEGLFADEIIGGSRVAPRAFHQNALKLIRIHQEKGKEVSASRIWGLSNGEFPGKERYEMTGVPEIAYSYFPGRFITPYSSFLAFRYDLRAAVKNLKKIEELNPSAFNSNYGFTDSINTKSAVINANILSLDKGMEVLSIGNLLNRLEEKKEIPNYFWLYLRKKGWEDKAIAILKAEEEHPSFQAISENKPHLLFRIHNQKCPMVFDLMVMPKKISVLCEPGRAQASFKLLYEEGRGRRQIILAAYAVKERYSYSGISIKYKEVDVSQYCAFSFEIKGHRDNELPVMFKVELKYQGVFVQFDHFRIDRKWKIPKREWTGFKIYLPVACKIIDEISIVFENASVGEEKKGEVLIRALKLE